MKNSCICWQSGKYSISSHYYPTHFSSELFLENTPITRLQRSAWICQWFMVLTSSQSKVGETRKWSSSSSNQGILLVAQFQKIKEWNRTIVIHVMDIYVSRYLSVDQTWKTYHFVLEWSGHVVPSHGNMISHHFSHVELVTCNPRSLSTPGGGWIPIKENLRKHGDGSPGGAGSIGRVHKFAHHDGWLESTEPSTSIHICYILGMLWIGVACVFGSICFQSSS